MADEPLGGLDRRDLLAASLASAGALAATVGGAGVADAQGTPAPTTGLAPPPPGGTVFTGDVIQGKRVISTLDVRDLEPGRKHLFYVQGVQTATGQHWYVSVMVAKGARPGRRILLTSGVHGDEISPMHTLQTIMNQLDPARMSGTVTAAFDVSRPAIEGMARRWPNSGRGIDLIDVNREWPGQENGFGAPARHAALLFEGLFRPNADYAIDFHTSATGMDMTAFHLARMDLPEVRAMAELFPIAITSRRSTRSSLAPAPSSCRAERNRTAAPLQWTEATLLCLPASRLLGCAYRRPACLAVPTGVPPAWLCLPASRLLGCAYRRPACLAVPTGVPPAWLCLPASRLPGCAYRCPACLGRSRPRRPPP